MADYPITTRVIIDGTEAYADVEDWDSGLPVVLDGLTFDWGRSTIADHPDASNLSFTLRQNLRAATKPMVKSLHVGAPVIVHSRSEQPDLRNNIYPDPGHNLGSLSPWSDPVAGGSGTVTITSGPATGNRVTVTTTADSTQVYDNSTTLGTPAELGLKVGDEVYYSAMVYVASGSTLGPSILNVYGSGVESTNAPSTDIPGRNSWQRVSVKATVTDINGNIAIRIFGGTKTGNVVHFDDFIVAPAQRDPVVWYGEVLTVSIHQVSDYVVEASMTCVDPLSFLQNLSVGDLPWVRQYALPRIQRVLELVKDTSTGFETPYGGVFQPVYEASVSGLYLVPKDVDAQPALSLLQDIATSIGAVLWVGANDSGPVMRFEDPYTRQGLIEFQINPLTGRFFLSGIAIPGGSGGVGYPRLSAADVERDIVYTQDPAQATSIVDLTWLEASTDTEGNLTTEEYTVSWANNDAVKKFGVRRLSIDTELDNEANANTVASKWLTRIDGSDWMLSQLPVDTGVLTREMPGYTDAERLDIVMDLLDSVTRPGTLVAIDDLPTEWTPEAMQGYHVEGGTYTWENSRWKLNLTVSANGLGKAALLEEIPREVLLSDIPTDHPTLEEIYMATAPEPTEWHHNVAYDSQLWFPWMRPTMFPVGTTIANLSSGAGNKAVITADMNSMRIWFIGTREASSSSGAPLGDDYYPVEPGETWEASYFFRIDAGQSRNMRLQANFRRADGTTTGSYGGSQATVPADTNFQLRGKWVIPADAVGISVAAVGDGSQAAYTGQMWGFDLRRYQGNEDTNVIQDPGFREAALNSVRFASVSGEVGTTRSMGSVSGTSEKLWLIGNQGVTHLEPTTGFFPCAEGQVWTLSAVLRSAQAGQAQLGVLLKGSYGTTIRARNFDLTTGELFFDYNVTTIPPGTTGLIPFIGRYGGTTGTISVRKPAARISSVAGSSSKPRPIPA